MKSTTCLMSLSDLPLTIPVSIRRNNQTLIIVRAVELVLDGLYHFTDSSHEELEEERIRELTTVNELCETYQDAKVLNILGRRQI